MFEDHDGFRESHEKKYTAHLLIVEWFFFRDYLRDFKTIYIRPKITFQKLIVQ